MPNADTILKAFEEIGRRLTTARQVELVVGGGSAALLLGLLPGSAVTADVDAFQFIPAEDDDEVLRVAGEVGEAMSLGPCWLDERSRLYFHELPEGWEGRIIEVATFGKLKLKTLSRLDFIAMKFFAHRPEDLEHLTEINPPVGREDLEFAQWHLKNLADRCVSPEMLGSLVMARVVLNEWQVRHDPET